MYVKLIDFYAIIVSEPEEDMGSFLVHLDESSHWHYKPLIPKNVVDLLCGFTQPEGYELTLPGVPFMPDGKPIVTHLDIRHPNVIDQGYVICFECINYPGPIYVGTEDDFEHYAKGGDAPYHIDKRKALFYTNFTGVDDDYSSNLIYC